MSLFPRTLAMLLPERRHRPPQWPADVFRAKLDELIAEHKQLGARKIVELLEQKATAMRSRHASTAPVDSKLF